MSINGGRNRLWGYETTEPLSLKDKLGCLGIIVSVVVIITALWWVFS